MRTTVPTISTKPYKMMRKGAAEKPNNTNKASAEMPPMMPTKISVQMEAHQRVFVFDVAN